ECDGANRSVEGNDYEGHGIREGVGWRWILDLNCQRAGILDVRQIQRGGAGGAARRAVDENGGGGRAGSGDEVRALYRERKAFDRAGKNTGGQHDFNDRTGGDRDGCGGELGGIGDASDDHGNGVGRRRSGGRGVESGGADRAAGGATAALAGDCALDSPRDGGVRTAGDTGKELLGNRGAGRRREKRVERRDGYRDVGDGAENGD